MPKILLRKFNNFRFSNTGKWRDETNLNGIAVINTILKEFISDKNNYLGVLGISGNYLEIIGTRKSIFGFDDLIK